MKDGWPERDIWIDEWIEKMMDAWMNGWWKERWMDRCMERYMNGWMNGYMDREITVIDRWVDRWMNRKLGWWIDGQRDIHAQYRKVNGWMDDGWTDRLIERQMEVTFISSFSINNHSLKTKPKITELLYSRNNIIITRTFFHLYRLISMQYLSCNINVYSFNTSIFAGCWFEGEEFRGHH